MKIRESKAQKKTQRREVAFTQASISRKNAKIVVRRCGLAGSLLPSALLPDDAYADTVQQLISLSSNSKDDTLTTYSV